MNEQQQLSLIRHRIYLRQNTKHLTFTISFNPSNNCVTWNFLFYIWLHFTDEAMQPAQDHLFVSGRPDSNVCVLSHYATGLSYHIQRLLLPFLLIQILLTFPGCISQYSPEKQNQQYIYNYIQEEIQLVIMDLAFVIMAAKSPTICHLQSGEPKKLV